MSNEESGWGDGRTKGRAMNPHGGRGGQAGRSTNVAMWEGGNGQRTGPREVSLPNVGQRWQAEALCVGAARDYWFPMDYEDPERLSDQARMRAQYRGAARAICGRCPVAEQCMALAVATKPEHGIWAGVEWGHDGMRTGQDELL